VDFIHAADVSSAIVEIVNKQKWDTYNISSGQCTSIIDIAETCISVVGNGRVKVIGEQTNNFKTRYMIDNRFSVKKLGWHPSIHLYEGITSVFEKKIIHAKNI
jgi:nucleoside-diphosphate-sugar epimerase